MCVVNGLSLVGTNVYSVCASVQSNVGYRRPSSFTPCKLQVALLKRERYEERDSSPTTLTDVPSRRAPSSASCFRQFHERDEIHLINRMLVSVFRPSLPRPKHPPPGAAAHGVKVVECLLSQRALRRRREHQSGGARLHRLQCGSGVVACTL